MSWNLSRLSGPWQVPIYGDPVIEPDTGLSTVPVVGYQPGVVFVLPVSEMTAALQAYAVAVPAGVPVLAGVPCVALAFTSEAAAKVPLAAYWVAGAS